MKTFTPEVLTSNSPGEKDDRANAIMRKHGLDPTIDGPDDCLVQCIHEALCDKMGMDPIYIDKMSAALRCYAETLDVFPTPKEEGLSTQAN